ncbi:hypothetical protein KU6B_27120 [Mameliella alba]|uniref:hypothetical protein n=1 Tax=Mameliella alba TaxID=561184 RepID=UPI0013E4BFDF|nr:hypothetical protein [Mameliella alba]BBU56447.1 hypothetical protein KU6B_27120 [Mameliella alba]
MTSEMGDNLIEYVTSENRVWPLKWHEFSKLIGLNKPGFLPPLILGGAAESDAAKRQRLIDQINFIATDPVLLQKADVFLRSLPEDGWYRSPDPLSDKDRW